MTEYLDAEIDPQVVKQYFPQKGKYKIIFYGGEPLLRFDYIVRLADALKEYNPDVALATISNGTLLTVDKAKKLNELEIGIGISHDGYNFEQTRGVRDFLKTNPEPYLTLNPSNRAIGATASRVNYNFYDVWDYFEEFRIKHGLKERESCRIDIVKDAEGNTAEALLIKDMPEFEQMLDKVFLNLETQLKKNNFDSYEYDQYYSMITTLNARLNNNQDRYSWCGADEHVCHLDIYGNLYACHNVETPNGHVEQGGARAGNYNPFKSTEKCRNCVAYVWCGGGCVASSMGRKEYECYANYHQFGRLIQLLNNLKGHI